MPEMLILTSSCGENEFMGLGPTLLELFLINKVAIGSLVNVISEWYSCQSARYDKVCLGFFEGAMDTQKPSDRGWRFIKGFRVMSFSFREKNSVISSY
jgi:hypothetical protein